MPAPKVQLFDSASGQWRLEAGVGRLRSFAPNGPRYVEVTIDAPPLVSPVTGWADRNAEPFTSLFAHGLGHAAIELQDYDVEYRVEVRRRQDVDKSIPLEELEPHQKRRRMVHLAVAPLRSPHHDDAEVTIELDTTKLDEALAMAPDAVRRLAHSVTQTPAPDEWDFTGFDFSANPAMPAEPGLKWDRYRVGLRRHIEQRYARQASDPAEVAGDDQLIATTQTWLTELGLGSDERTVFTLITALSFLQAGLLMRGHLCPITAHEIDLLVDVFSMLVPEWVIVDA